MPTGRMEAFSDGVIAILITVMVLELGTPEGAAWADLHHLAPKLLAYLLSFVYLGIYWNNHHHMLMVTERVGGLVLWANLHLLFWLSLVPFATDWMAEQHFAKTPVVVYGVALLAAAIAYYLLQTAIIRTQGGEKLAAAIGADAKGKLSPVIYSASIILAFVDRWLAIVGYVVVALIWLIPDRRVERVVAATTSAAD
jgi:uncharacterized membrane protein